MKALIIDDTRLARQELRYLLKNFPEVEVLSEAANAEEARSLIDNLRPELLFLDIQMPGEDGFELLASLEEAPEVIFTTAYSEYALKAFEYNALDYLQKPITEERLALSLEKVKLRLSQKNAVQKMLHEHSQVFVRDGERCWFVQLREVKLLEVQDHYTRIYFQDQKPMITRTLNYMESRLDPEVFFRANRQQIINLKWIDRVEPWFSGTLKIYLRDGTEVEVSRRQTARFKDILSF